MAGNKGEEVFSKRKKQKSPNVEEANEDRLSSLTDFLILHILSFLEIQEVVKTCVLSKRWKFIWTDISEIDISSSLNSDYAKDKLLMKGVGKILKMCNGTHLKRFAYSFYYSEFFVSKINSWVHFLVKNKVKDISLRIGLNSEYVLPQMLYLHSSMTNLNISSCKIDPRGVIQWGSLKRLEMENVELTDCLMEKILLSCPVLEVVKLEEVIGLTCFNISSPNLTTLELESFEYFKDGDHELRPFFEIWAPHLRVLSIEEGIRGKRFRLKNISSLVRAEIYFDGTHKDYEIAVSPSMLSYMKELLSSLHSVMDLKLGSWCTELLSSLVLKGWKAPLSTRLSLTLSAATHKGFIGILGILKSSPKLKTLVIRGMLDLAMDEEFIAQDQVATYLQDHKMDFVMFHLKIIEITGFTREHLLSETMLLLVKLLLKSSNVLEKMVIREELVESSSPGDSTCLSEFALKLLTFPKASPKAVVMVC